MPKNSNIERQYTPNEVQCLEELASGKHPHQAA
jgi:hypothetical protein